MQEGPELPGEMNSLPNRNRSLLSKGDEISDIPSLQGRHNLGGFAQSDISMRRILSINWKCFKIFFY